MIEGRGERSRKACKKYGGRKTLNTQFLSSFFNQVMHFVARTAWTAYQNAGFNDFYLCRVN